MILRARTLPQCLLKTFEPYLHMIHEGGTVAPLAHRKAPATTGTYGSATAGL